MQTQEVQDSLQRLQQKLLLAASTFLLLSLQLNISSSPHFDSDHMLFTVCYSTVRERERLKVQSCKPHTLWLSPCVCFWLSQTPATVEMATGDLVPTHFPARRAAQVALHYLNTRHGSPFRVFGLQQVHKAKAEVRLSFTSAHAVCTDNTLEDLSALWETSSQSLQPVNMWIRVFDKGLLTLVLTGRGNGREEVQPGFLRDWLRQFGMLHFCSSIINLV